jgi:hypothetical protein
MCCLKERKDEASFSKARTHGSGWRARSLYAIGLVLRRVCGMGDAPYQPHVGGAFYSQRIESQINDKGPPNSSIDCL